MSYFKTTLRTEENPPKDWLLIGELIYDNGDRRIVVPAGLETDLASIPVPFRNLFNINGKSRKAAVLHDYLYSHVLCVTRKEADLLFYEALVDCGVNWFERNSLYSGVRIGGWLRFEKCRHEHNS